MATPIQTSRELMAHSPHNPSLLESCFLCSCPSRLVLYNGSPGQSCEDCQSLASDLLTLTIVTPLSLHNPPSTRIARPPVPRPASHLSAKLRAIGAASFAQPCRATATSTPSVATVGAAGLPCLYATQAPTQGGDGWGNCNLQGITLSNGKVLANLAILTTLFLLWRSERKKAAVGRREMQLFLLGYIIVSICEIFTVGGFPLDSAVRKGFVAAHIAAIIATTWILMLNGLVGYQLLDDGTAMSLGLILVSAAILFIGTGFIALDTGFSWTGYFDDTLQSDRSYSLYTLYQLAPLVFLFVFFCLETFLVVRVLGETKPMIYLISAVVLFAIAQVFQYVISVHICNGTDGKINGGLFETLFTLLSVVMIWVFWSSITEDDWPTPGVGGTGAYS
ncbi:hypothetical protein GRF29_1g776101 [Pseudopithomyces chartarum]|uniref:Chitin synthase export chaperone n=1 Tax=Pseudopithomyces chartarum TaxID=1892770 RepID=A0AAN6M9A4_9PLEO|nr:hypothetical protein GRF29_1g776101 [Pseudopithomyces chartarum]